MPDETIKGLIARRDELERQYTRPDLTDAEWRAISEEWADIEVTLQRLGDPELTTTTIDTIADGKICAKFGTSL